MPTHKKKVYYPIPYINGSEEPIDHKYMQGYFVTEFIETNDYELEGIRQAKQKIKDEEWVEEFRQNLEHAILLHENTHIYITDIKFELQYSDRVVCNKCGNYYFEDEECEHNE